MVSFSHVIFLYLEYMLSLGQTLHLIMYGDEYKDTYVVTHLGRFDVYNTTIHASNCSEEILICICLSYHPA